MSFPGTVMTPITRPGGPDRPAAHFSQKLIDIAHSEPAGVLDQLGSAEEGLSPAEAAARLVKYGPNEIAAEKRISFLARLWDNIKNPLVLLLLALGLISYFTGDTEGAIIIGAMVVLGIVLRFVQESPSPPTRWTRSGSRAHANGPSAPSSASSSSSGLSAPFSTT